jgi:hypothetical protein
VKRSGRDEPVQIAIHKCMEATLGISLYSYLYPKLAKTLWLSNYLFCFLFTKIGEQEGIPRGEGRWQEQCIHVSKCKNDKKKMKF